MPIFRGKVNRAVTEFTNAKKANTTQYNSGRASFLDKNGMNREINAQEKLKELMKKRKSAPLGTLRKLLSPKAYANLVKLRQYTRNKNRIDLSKIHPLLKSHRIGDTIITISRKGNIRKGKILGASSEFLRIRTGKEEVVLRIRQLSRITKFGKS